jgi:DNA repair photolyase
MSERPVTEKEPRKGRGAVSNPSGRFERFQHEPVADADAYAPDDDPPRRLETTITPEKTKNIIARNDSPDVGFDRSINPYKGCEHGCIYCFARPTHAFLGLSPGLDFETKIFSKPEAAQLLRRALAKPGYKAEVLVVGANTDAYQPAERDLKITRSVLEVLQEHRHPVSIITKSHLVVRDADILGEMARDNLASVNHSITTLDPQLARTMEPRAATPERRLAAMKTLAEADVPVGVLASPMIPALNDSELERILEAAATNGAQWANYILVRLPHELKELFSEWLSAHYPARAEHVLSILRDMRGGNLYDSRWGTRMRGQGPFADLLEKRFEVTCRKLGLNQTDRALNTTKFRVPAPHTAQRRLFS